MPGRNLHDESRFSWWHVRIFYNGRSRLYYESSRFWWQQVKVLFSTVQIFMMRFSWGQVKILMMTGWNFHGDQSRFFLWVVEILSLCLSLCLSLSLSLSVSLSVSLCLSLCLSVCLSLSVSLCLSLSVTLCLSLPLSLSLSLSVSLSRHWKANYLSKNRRIVRNLSNIYDRRVSTGGSQWGPGPPNNFSDFCFAKCNKTCSALHLCCHLHLPRQQIMVDLWAATWLHFCSLWFSLWFRTEK